MAITIQSADALVQRLINNNAQERRRSGTVKDNGSALLPSDHVEISDAAHQAKASGVGLNRSRHSLESQLIKLFYGRNGKIS